MSILKSLLFFILFLGICLGAFYGVTEPKNTLVSSVGPMQITTAGNGLTLFQDTKGQYYNFSPFTDTVTYQNASESALITSEDIKSPGYKTSLHLTFAQNILETLKSYAGITTPHIEFQTDKRISYSSSVLANKLTVKRTVFGENKSILKSDMTLSFNSVDFVFDRAGNSYNYVDPAMQSLFEQTFGRSLTPKLEDTSTTVLGNIVFIYSPKIAAVIAIQTVGNQTITVDRNARVIRVSGAPSVKNKAYESIMTVSVLSSPKEAFSI